MDPNSGTSDTAAPRPIRGTFPPFLVYLIGLLLAFELLVVLGVIAQPVPSIGGPPVKGALAALVGSLAYLSLMIVWRGPRRLTGWTAVVPISMCLGCVVGGGFSQLTAVLMPRTLVSSSWDAVVAPASVTTIPSLGGYANSGAIALLIVALAIAFECAYRDSERHARSSEILLSSIVVATTVAGILCIFVPIASQPFLVGTFRPSLSSVVPPSAIVPSRLGAVSFPVLWMTVLVANVLHGSRESRNFRRVVVFGMLLVVVAILAFRFEPRASIAVPVAIVIGALGLVRHQRNRATAAAASARAAHAAIFTPSDIGLISVFFMSGAAALVYQVVFAKGLALTFGSTSHASTIVLATYMSGLALGSWVGGRFAERVTRPIRVYAGCELGIAMICVVAPYTLKATRALYVVLASGSDPAQSWLVGLQLGLGALVLIPPTFLMGITMPMLTRHLLARRESLGVSSGVLYSSNTLGAAAGALLTGYLLMPAFGVTTSLRIAVALNIVVAAIAIILGRGLKMAEPAKATSRENVSPELRVANSTSSLESVLGWIALAQLTVGGFVTFGLETTFVHLLATIAGTSAYAFSLMLFAFLIGLGVGSNLARRWIRPDRNFASALLFCQAMLALTLLLGVPFWDGIPGYFALFGSWAPANTFAARELIRALACLVVMLPPALFIGAQFPIAMDVIGRAWAVRRVAALGFTSALNTLGNILGALVVGFVMLPKAGSLGTLHLLIVACLFLAALSLPYVTKRLKLATIVLLVAEVVLYLKQPVEFNLTSLASGGNVYFQHQHYGRVIDSAESLDGGLTTVAISGDETEWSVLTLLTNGKFQGDDSTGGEMKAQSSFALAPLLHTPKRNRALVIGFGTGTTTKVFHQAGFAQIDVAELSGDILTLADRYFRAVNSGVLHQPQVKAHVTDGRNFLLLNQSHYDVISIELTSIWFAGAANLYNREFYQLIRNRLAPGGVFQQWVQLHRLSESDIAIIFSTLSEQFPSVWLYFLGKQGILVACQQRCEPSQQALIALDESPLLASTLRLFDGHAGQVLKGRVLTPDTLKRLVADAKLEYGSTLGPLIATDDNVRLEYSTPRGNVRPYDESLDKNLRYLDKYKANNLFAATALVTGDVPYLSE